MFPDTEHKRKTSVNIWKIVRVSN